MKWLLLALMLLASPVYAVDTPLQDPALELRARALFSQLRCMVCEGQALDSSNAKMAVQMRELVRKKVRSGESDTQIMRFFIDRYGVQIAMNPPVNTSTYALWAAPVLFVLCGAFVMLMRRRTAA